MNSFKTLPNGYSEVLRINLQKDKKPALIINSLGVIIMLIMAIIGHNIVPITKLFDMSDGIVIYFLRFAILLLATIAYMILHELIHGVFMKAFGAGKIKYGFTGLYAFAGCDCYFKKNAYIVIALAPIIILGIIILLINFIVPENYFWIVYFVQITNISGAAGDLYVTRKFIKLPKNILINDTGIEMTVFSLPI